MLFITGNQRMDFLSFTKQVTYTPFATDGIVGKIQVTGYTQSHKECTIHSNSTRHSRIVEPQFSREVLLYAILESFVALEAR